MLIKFIIKDNHMNIMDIELINWLKSSKYRIPIIKLLEKENLMPSEMAKILKINRSSISRLLKEIKKENLINEVSNKAKTKTYFLTLKSKKLLKSDIFEKY